MSRWKCHGVKHGTSLLQLFVMAVCSDPLGSRVKDTIEETRGGQKMTKQHPTEPLRRLQAAIKRVTLPIGVRLVGFQFALTEGSDDIVSLRFQVSPDKIVKASTVEQKQYDDIFDDIIGGIDFKDPPEGQGMTLGDWEDE